MVRLVKFPNEKEEERAYLELTFAHQTVENVDHLKYDVTEKQCELLKSRDIKYRVLKRS